MFVEMTKIKKKGCRETAHLQNERLYNKFDKIKKPENNGQSYYALYDRNLPL